MQPGFFNPEITFHSFIALSILFLTYHGTKLKIKKLEGYRMTKKLIKKKHTSKSTTDPQKRKTSAPLYKRENMEFFLTNGNATIASIEKFADDQLEYIINNKDVLHIKKYYLSKGVRRDLYYRWVNKSKYLKNRHELCMEILGLRREELMAESNPSTLKHTLHQYSKEWADAEKYHANLKKKEEDKGSSIIKVFVPKCESVIDREKYKPVNRKDVLQKDTNNEHVKHEGQLWERAS